MQKCSEGPGRGASNPHWLGAGLWVSRKMTWGWRKKKEFRVELEAPAASCKAEPLFPPRPCPVAGTQQLWTSSRGFSANPPLCLSLPSLKSLVRAFSLRSTEICQSPRVSSNGAEIRSQMSYSPSFSILNSWAFMELLGLSCILKAHTWNTWWV